MELYNFTYLSKVRKATCVIMQMLDQSVGPKPSFLPPAECQY